MHAQQRRVLRVVLWINVVMFLAGLSAGLVYGFSLYVIGRAPIWQSCAAFLKGVIMAGFAVGILAEVGTKLIRGLTPDATIMWAMALAALVANGSVLVFLSRHRADDINMRSAWLCSRNDVIANGGVLIAALGVGLTGSAWPDILVGLGIAALFGASAMTVIREVTVAPR